MSPMSKRKMLPTNTSEDMLSVLDEELNRLPPRYRTALVACELEGKSRHEAAIAARTARGHALDPPGARAEDVARAIAPARRQPGSRAVRRAGAADHRDQRPRAAGRFHGSGRTGLSRRQEWQPAQSRQQSHHWPKECSR